MPDIPGWAVRGSKVVCVERDDWCEMRAVVTDEHGLMSYPQFGKVYTIREVLVRYVPEYSEALTGILLDEVENPTADGGSANGNEPGFDINGFRPVARRSEKLERSIPAPSDELIQA